MPLNSWCPRYFQALGLSLSAYSLFLYAGGTIFILLFLREADRRGELREPYRTHLSGLIVLSSTLVGSALSWVTAGGFALSLYSGMLGALVAVFFYCRSRSLSLLHVGDAGAAAAALAFAVMKLGCLVGGCCYGGPTHAALHVAYAKVAGETLPKVLTEHPEWNLVPLLPLQLWVTLLALGIFAALTVFRDRLAATPGRTFAVALGLYAAGRLVLDFWSAETAVVSVAGLSGHQWLGVGMLAVAALVGSGKLTARADVEGYRKWSR